ncbi:MAG: endonuclease [Planctomycetes bacterium]|nr:endonuclease [Planctomycetota bacterium]
MNKLPIQTFLALSLASFGSPGPAQGQESTGARWVQSRVIDAPEAIQAAAADDKCVYAISSTEVAKYDRESGKRIATSTGDATHLNSGFVWERRLYCAHSNYPQTPEKSELKVLDLETMRLTTFREFGNFGGSLTWAVRQKDHWWCNFARYGKDNGETFLVKFDAQWQEQGRWTYPPEVIRELDNFSLSGGVWLDGSLFVTDHDHQVLYRMTIPQEGQVLKFIEKQPVPFTGQGIAVDPKGGMVGINRAKRQVVFAQRETRAKKASERPVQRRAEKAPD